MISTRMFHIKFDFSLVSYNTCMPAYQHLPDRQDRQPICELPEDLSQDQSLQAQIEEACKSLTEAKEGTNVSENLLKARL